MVNLKSITIKKFKKDIYKDYRLLFSKNERKDYRILKKNYKDNEDNGIYIGFMI